MRQRPPVGASARSSAFPPSWLTIRAVGCFRILGEYTKIAHFCIALTSEFSEKIFFSQEGRLSTRLAISCKFRHVRFAQNCESSCKLHQVTLNFEDSKILTERGRVLVKSFQRTYRFSRAGVARSKIAVPGGILE